jgi:hypothetical protein
MEGKKRKERIKNKKTFRTKKRREKEQYETNKNEQRIMN